MATRATFERLIGLAGLRAPTGHTFSEYIDAAIEELSRVAPRLVRFDITGDGSDEYPLGTTAGTNLWERSFSTVQRVEWRDSADFDEAARYLTGEEYVVEYNDSDAAVIRFNESPSSSDKVIVEYTVRHTLSESASTIESKDETAFKALIEAMILEALAQGALGRDVAATDSLADPRIEEAREYRIAAKMRREAWDRHFGITKAAEGASEVRAAMAVADLDAGDPRSGYALGMNRHRHTHSRRRY